MTRFTPVQASPGASTLLAVGLVCGCGRSQPAADAATDPFSSSSATDPTSSEPVDPGTTGSMATTAVSGGDSDGTCVPAPPGSTDAFECSLLEQDCPAASKCMPWANGGGSYWNATRCTCIADSPRKLGEPCVLWAGGTSGVDDCERGTMCWSLNPERAEGYCAPLCGGGSTGPELLSTCARSDETCRVMNEGALALCVPRCEPYGPPCPQNQLCLPSSYDPQWSCVPRSVSDDIAVDPCEFANVCPHGSLCVDTIECVDAVSCCTESCSEDGTLDTCPDPTRPCRPWYAPGRAPIGEEGLGSCSSNPLPTQPPSLAETIRGPAP